MTVDDLGLDGRTREVLDRFGFDAHVFAYLRERLRASGGKWDNVVRGTVDHPAPADVAPLPPEGSEQHRALTARGLEAIAAGQVAAVVLAGGMATRFGGVVKAASEVLPGRSFLQVKLADVALAATRARGSIPVYLMASFATFEHVRALGARASRPEVPVETFTQSVSVRLTPEGDPFHEEGRPSLYAPGHGDLTFALRRSGLLRRFREAGGRALFVSNVDNAVATLDPAIVGAHLDSGRALTVEVAPKEPGDRGGAPARVNGVAQIVESFRFPSTFDQDAIPVFNTNTFVMDPAAIDRDFELTWFAVRKTIDARAAVQFERLMGELTAFLPTHFLRVEREGVAGRFQPAKDPEELERRRPAIAKILAGRGVL